MTRCWGEEITRRGGGSPTASQLAELICVSCHRGKLRWTKVPVQKQQTNKKTEKPKREPKNIETRKKYLERPEMSRNATKFQKLNLVFKICTPKKLINLLTSDENASHHNKNNKCAHWPVVTAAKNRTSSFFRPFGTDSLAWGKFRRTRLSFLLGSGVNVNPCTWKYSPLSSLLNDKPPNFLFRSICSLNKSRKRLECLKICCNFILWP